MLGSIARGVVVATSTAITMALPRSFDLATSVWVSLLVALHLALPISAAFWGRRSDSTTLDIGLAGIGVTYMGLLALVNPPEHAVLFYLGLPLAYAAYACLATVIFALSAKWRRVLRIRGLRRLRAEVRAREVSSI